MTSGRYAPRVVKSRHRVLLNELHAQIKTSVDEVRSVAHRLHPPELELFGLTQALQETAGQYQGRGKDGMRVQVHIPHTLDTVPLAVEVAAYYIVGEALTNASRHASASICRLSLQLLESSIPAQKFNTRFLEVEICDDGCGLAGERGVHQVGLGILSMRERASELGGILTHEEGTHMGIDPVRKNRGNDASHKLKKRIFSSFFPQAVTASIRTPLMSKYAGWNLHH